MPHFVKQLPTRHRFFILLLLVLLSVLLLLPSDRATASKGSQSEALQVGKRYSLPQPFASDTANTEVSDTLLLNSEPEYAQLTWTTLQVQRGDVLSSLFRKAGVDQQSMLAILALGDSTKTLKRLFPGEQLQFGLDEHGQLLELRYDIDKLTSLWVSRQPQGHYLATVTEKQVEKRQQFASAQIRSTFWQAGISAGLSESQIMQLAGIFGWDIDFALDIRANDSFSVIYEAQFVDGEFIGNGAIIAAQFQNQSHLYQAVRHSDGNYYKPNGASMRQAFLRAPVSFQYVSSNFNPRRLHPVLGTVRAHNGVDYVAPVGTPIMAAGDGRVTHSAYNNVNGHYVFIQHANNIVTKYLHLSRRDVKAGDRVRQSQTIGRLGATGRVTGAHLHYEFLLDGVHRNPRTVKLPQATPLTGAEQQQFSAFAQPILAQLQSQERLLLAKAD
ncbi:peptidoglycan DD-metalloendopeptidase family protein [Arsukibacterium sp.]|uniref:peptidoglycan DD-metalloendopeptidase family protein n=1 Tax=Arsukibacterium sp. TaxID=1977258 RepID=UPI002FD87D72